MASSIQLRGARTHNLKGVDLDLALGTMTVICGVSGSGKSSLALDTLHVEGRRRLAQTLSAVSYTHLTLPTICSV